MGAAAVPMFMMTLGSAALSSALAPKPKTPKMPILAEPEEMPVPDDERANQARKKALAARGQRQGRDSTQLSTIFTSNLGGT